MPSRRASVALVAFALILPLTSRAAPPAEPPSPTGAAAADAAPEPGVSEGPAVGEGPPAPMLDEDEIAAAIAGEGASPMRRARSGSDAQASLLSADDPVRALFEMPPAARDDAYGPRPPGVPEVSREQLVRYGLDNPYVHAADAHVEAMEALLLRARFAWVPVIKASAVLTPGAAIECDDVSVQGEDGPFSFQYCRAAGDPEDGSNFVDLQTVTGYFQRIADAGIALRLEAEFVAPITTFGKIVQAKRLAKVGVEVAEIKAIGRQQDTVLEIYRAHAALLLARQSIAILSEAWGIIQQERSKIASDLGLGPDGLPAFDADPEVLNLERDPDDLVRLEVGELEIASRMREARLIEAKALATLWAIAGNAAPLGVDIAERDLSPDPVAGGLRELPYYQGLALQRRPEARLADAGVEARRVQEKLARANFLPDLGAVVRFGYGYANKATLDMRALYYTGRLNYSSIYFGLALSWNIQFHNDAFALKRARAERREAEYEREAARRLLRLEVEEAYRALLDAEQQMAFTALGRDKSWKLVVSEQTSGSIGASDFEDLRRALTKWAEFEFQHFEAIMNRNTALARLSRAVGVQLSGPQAGEPAGTQASAPVGMIEQDAIAGFGAAPPAASGG